MARRSTDMKSKASGKKRLYNAKAPKPKVRKPSEPENRKDPYQPSHPLDLSGERFFRITNKDEKHNSYQWVDGMNVDHLPFRYSGTCCPGGLYFTDAENILVYMNGASAWIREVQVPADDITVVRDPQQDKWRSHRVIAGERRSLVEVSTWHWIREQGIYGDALKAVEYLRDKGREDLLVPLLGAPIDTRYLGPIFSAGHRETVAKVCAHIAVVGTSKDRYLASLAATFWSVKDAVTKQVLDAFPLGEKELTDLLSMVRAQGTSTTQDKVEIVQKVRGGPIKRWKRRHGVLGKGLLAYVWAALFSKKVGVL